MALRGTFTQTKLFRALIVSGIIILCIVFQPRFIIEPIRVVIATISWPAEEFFSTIAFETRDFFRFFSSIGDLKSENERLEKENVALLAENSKWQAVSQENEILRRELELLPRKEFQLKAAEVIGRDVTGLGNWLTIDQGSFQGVNRGMAVVVGESVLVGRVTEVSPQSSKVMLLSHPESLVSGVATESGAQGIVKGEHGLGILFDMVSQTDVLTTSDTLVTSGLGGELPKGLLIGTLQEVRLSADHLFQQASVISPVKFGSLRYVFIIQNSLTP